MAFLRLPILKAIPAFLVALAGVGLAWIAFRRSIWLAALLAALPIVIGLATFWWGNRLLTKRKPVDAVKFLEWGVLVPGTVVAVTSGLLIGAGVFLEPSKTASVETQKTPGRIARGDWRVSDSVLHQVGGGCGCGVDRRSRQGGILR